MTDAITPEVLEDEVFELTPQGKKELHGSATSLTPAALEVLVLIDGKATAAETAARARTSERAAAFLALGELLRDGLIAKVDNQGLAFDVVDFFQSKASAQSSQAATAQAQKAAVATAALLQQRGYIVRIARRGGSRNKPTDASNVSVLVIEDEPKLLALLGHVLASEGYAVRTAMNREEIVAALRSSPRPDLVLLDVVLPDVDGFLVLARLREHPILKSVPVVMLTAKATREAVIKGLAGGADGYITKPFEIEVLIKAVKVVLGFSEGNEEPDPDIWSG